MGWGEGRGVEGGVNKGGEGARNVGKERGRVRVTLIGGGAKRHSEHPPGAPKMSGRVRASPTRLRVISSSPALVVSLSLLIMASRCSLHRGSMRLMRMCSAISSTATSSPVMGETANRVGSYTWGGR